MQGILCARTVLVHDRHVPGIRVLPLLDWPVEIIAFVVEVTEAFLKPGFRLAADESVDERRAEIPIPAQQLENLKIAVGDLEVLSGADTAHSGSAVAHPTANTPTDGTCQRAAWSD